MAEKATNYQCPLCGGALHFSDKTGRLQCDYCDNGFYVQDIEDYYAEKDRAATDALNKDADTIITDDVQKAQYKKVNKGDGTINDDWGEIGDDYISYVCPSCGAELICEKTTAATSCPYCGNNTIIPGNVSDFLEPDYIIPFKKNREDAEQALAKTFKGKILLPKEFKDPANIQKVQGVYVPFWMFDSMIYVDAEYEGTRSTTYRDGDYIVKETDHYDIYRQADVYFNMVPADASSKMPDELMDAIEPYYYGDMVTFSKGYLPGYLADKYDIDVADVKWKATRRMDNTASSYVRDSIFGYDFVRTERYDSSVTHNKISYAMLPVWILKTKWQEKSYLFAMNGQTGKMIGDLPISEKRFWLFLGAVALVAALILFVCGAGYKILENASLGSAENCRTFFAVLICMGFGFIAGLIAALAARTGMKTAGLAKKADNYLNGKMSSITYRSDEFSHTEVSRTYSPENNDNNNNNHRY